MCRIPRWSSMAKTAALHIAGKHKLKKKNNPVLFSRLSWLLYTPWQIQGSACDLSRVKVSNWSLGRGQQHCDKSWLCVSRRDTGLPIASHQSFREIAIQLASCRGWLGADNGGTFFLGNRCDPYLSPHFMDLGESYAARKRERLWGGLANARDKWW